MRALVAALLLLPGLAHADPVSIFASVLAFSGSAAVAGTVAAVGSFLATYGAVVGLVAVNVFGAAAGRRKARKAAARQRSEYNASLQDRNITALTANPPWRVVYGRCITGGDIVAVFTTDKTGTRQNGSSFTKPDALKHLVIVLAAHQVQAINDVLIDGVSIGALDGNGWVTTGEFFANAQTATRHASIAPGGYVDVSPAVTEVLNSYVVTGSNLERSYTAQTVNLSLGNTRITNPNGSQTAEVDYTIAYGVARVRVSKHLGTDSQTVDTYLNGVAPGQWHSDCRLRGLAYVVVTLDLEETRFQGGPPQMTFDVSGRLVYDTRAGTTAWSSNPALIVRDFLLAPWGYACTAADVDTALCNAAANACDVAINLNVGGTVTNGPTYTCNGAFSTADSREAILEDLCESMAGFATYGATWGIQAGAWTAPVLALTDDDLDGQIEVVQAGGGLDGLFNGLRGQYIAAGKATPSDFDSYQNAAFLAADGQALWSDIALPFTDNKARARNLARIFVERNRDGLVIRYPAKLRAWPLQIGDRVTVTSAEYGFSAKTFRVTDWQFGLGTAVQLTLQEDAAAVYDLADAATADPAPNTALPNPWAVAALTNVDAVSGASTVLKSGTQPLVPRILVTWDAVTDAYVVDGSGRIEVRWQRPDSPWQQADLPGDATQAYITGVDDRDFVLIEVRARNGLGQAGPSVFIGHVVLGSAALPEGNLVDPSWWRAGATLEWVPRETNAGENSIVWGTGPRGLSQALWQCVAAGTPGAGADGGWEYGSIATTPKNAFVVNPLHTYRFAVAVRRTSGTGTAYFGVPHNGVCALNTATLDGNPYFCSDSLPPDGRWYLMTGYVYPAGSTGLTHAGAGIYDMETGALVTPGLNFCWPAGITESGTRAYQFYASTGATQHFCAPLVELFNGSDQGRITYLGGGSVATGNLADRSVTSGEISDTSETIGSSGSPGASGVAGLLIGPSITTEAGDQLDFHITGLHTQSYWSQAVLVKVQIWLVWNDGVTGGGTDQEFAVPRKKYPSPVDVYTSSTEFGIEYQCNSFEPGATTRTYKLKYLMSHVDAAGAAKLCAKDFSATAQWRIVRRKR